MLKFAKSNTFIEIYVQHFDQQGISGNVGVGEASKHINKNEVFLHSKYDIKLLT